MTHATPQGCHTVGHGAEPTEEDTVLAWLQAKEHQGRLWCRQMDPPTGQETLRRFAVWVFVEALVEACRPTAAAFPGMVSALPHWTPCKTQEHAWQVTCAASAERARTSSVASSFE